MVSIGEVENIYSTCPGLAACDWMLLETLPEVSRLTTPNTATPYIIYWFNLAKTGPLVHEWAAGQVAGFAEDLWQRPLIQLGVPGQDKGHGGKCLLLGPGQERPAGAEGYTIVPSSTFNGFIVFRLLSPDPRERQQFLEGTRVYPYDQRDNPPASNVLARTSGPTQTLPRAAGLLGTPRRNGSAASRCEERDRT